MSDAEEFIRLLEVMHTLRRECPWDRKQTHASLRPYLLEETYEVLHALDEGSMDALKEELGDLLLQVVFHAELAQETGAFDISDVMSGISGKLIRRHPHVFANVKVDTPDQVVSNWERVKRNERDRKSALEGVPDELPALLRAARALSKIRQTGVDPFDARDPAEDVRLWLERVEAAIDRGERNKIVRGIGMIVLAMAELAGRTQVDPEVALRTTLGRLTQAFQREESEVLDRGEHFGDLSEKERGAISQRLLKGCEEG